MHTEERPFENIGEDGLQTEEQGLGRKKSALLTPWFWGAGLQNSGKNKRLLSQPLTPMVLHHGSHSKLAQRVSSQLLNLHLGTWLVICRWIPSLLSNPRTTVPSCRLTLHNGSVLMSGGDGGGWFPPYSGNKLACCSQTECVDTRLWGKLEQFFA